MAAPSRIYDHTNALEGPVIVGLAWAAIVLLATYLTFIGGGWLGIYSSPLRIISVAGAGVVLATWFALWPRRPKWRPRSALTLAIGAALASLAISTLFSRVPRMSLEYLGYAVVLAGLYLLLVRLMAHPFFGRRLLVLGAMFFVAVSGAFLTLVVAHWIDWWAILGRFAIPPLRPNFEGLTYLNPSAVLTIAALFAVPAVALSDPATRWGRIGIGAVLVVLGLVAFLTGSRAGWLAIALTMVVGAVAAAIDPEVRNGIRVAFGAVMARRRTRTGAALVVAAGVVALAAFAPAIARRVGESGELTRTQYAIAAIRMFSEAPIVGTGPGTWVIQRAAETMTGEPDFVIPHAHNLEVQTLAELGLVGAAAGVVLIVLLGRLVIGAMRDPDPFRRRLGWATFLGLSYLVFHQLLDFYANMPAALFAAALPVAYLDATSKARVESHPIDRQAVRVAARRIPTVAIAIAVGASVLGLLLIEVPANQGQQAVELADRGEWAAADADARGAANVDPAIGSYSMVAGLAAARTGDHAAAAEYFRRVAQSDDLPEAWLDLAAEQLALGQAAEARSSLEHAFRLGRQRAGLSLAVGDVALRAGDRQLAVQAFATVLATQPTVAADEWWSATPERLQAFEQASALLDTRASPGLGWRIAMVTGDYATAHARASAEVDAAFIHTAIDAWSGQEHAIADVTALCYASPLDAGRLNVCGKVAAHVGQQPWAKDMRDLLEALGPGLSNDAGQITITESVQAADRLAGRTIPFWGVFTYRRPVPRSMIVPGVAQLVVR